MTNASRLRIVVSTALALAAPAAPAAWAYFTATGSGTASAAVGTLAPPTGVSGAPTASTVAVSWTGTAAPGGGAVDGYHVQRFQGATPSPACGTSPTSLTSGTATGCSDTSVAPGTYTYKVTAVFRSWTAQSAASAPVVVSASTVHHFLVSAPASATAGTAFNVTVTAQDVSNNTVTGYAGAKTLVWSGPANAPSGAAPTYPANVTFTAGTGTASVTLRKAETVAITATEGAASGTSANVVVNPGLAANLAWTNVSVSAGTVSSLCLFTCTNPNIGNNGTFTANVSVTDGSGNVVSGLGAGHTVTVSGDTGFGGSFTAPTMGSSVVLTISATGPATSTAQLTYKGKATGNFTDEINAMKTSGAPYDSATATFMRG